MYDVDVDVDVDVADDGDDNHAGKHLWCFNEFTRLVPNGGNRKSNKKIK